MIDIIIVAAIVGVSVWYLWKNIRKQSKGQCSCEGCKSNCSLKE